MPKSFNYANNANKLQKTNLSITKLTKLIFEISILQWQTLTN